VRATKPGGGVPGYSAVAVSLLAALAGVSLRYTIPSECKNACLCLRLWSEVNDITWMNTYGTDPDLLVESSNDEFFDFLQLLSCASPLSHPRQSLPLYSNDSKLEQRMACFLQGDGLLFLCFANADGLGRCPETGGYLFNSLQLQTLLKQIRSLVRNVFVICGTLHGVSELAFSFVGAGGSSFCIGKPSAVPFTYAAGQPE
jgi:hypothetical protein